MVPAWEISASLDSGGSLLLKISYAENNLSRDEYTALKLVHYLWSSRRAAMTFMHLVEQAMKA
jgi:hypothetical protein